MINVDAPVGALKTKLSKILLSVDRVGWETGNTSGRFDVRRTSRMLSGSERVFKGRTESPALTTAVSIVIDLSGSMNERQIDAAGIWNSRAEVASQCAYAIATAVERSNCDVEVVGFRSNGWDSFDSSKGMSGAFGEDVSFKSIKASRKGHIINIKSFNQKCLQRKEAFEMMAKAVNGGTPDYYATRAAVEGVAKLDNHRKIVIVITDGIGDASNQKLLTETSEKLFGVTVLGLGILTSDREMDMAYNKYVAVDSLQELTDKGINALIKLLKDGGNEIH